MTYTDYDRMLADPEVDAVIVAIADQFHVPMALKAIAAGKHVLVEKPMGVDVEECETLATAVDAWPLIWESFSFFFPQFMYMRSKPWILPNTTIRQTSFVRSI